MPEHKRVQKVLREQFSLRCFILFLSVFGIVIYGIINGIYPRIGGLIIGISCSALVWAVVELVDFVINTFHQYNIDRNLFMQMVFEHCHKIVSIIKKDVNVIDFKEIKSEIDMLYNDVAQYPFNGPIYSISKEFEEFYNYICRLFWKFYSVFFNTYDILPIDSEKYNILYNSVIYEESIEKSGIDVIYKTCVIKDKNKCLRDIEICFEPFHAPNEILSEGCEGNISQKFGITGNIEKRCTLKIQKDFEDKLKNTQYKNALKTVGELLFKKIAEN